MKNKGTNITPVLEDVLGISEIDSAEDLQMLVDALESMPPDTKINAENMAKVMEIIKTKREEETEVVFIPTLNKEMKELNHSKNKLD
jgi:hypothetical protein